MKEALLIACESLRDRLELIDNRNRIRAKSARLTRKGSTMYVVSPEARELRRIDAIFAEGASR